MAAEIIWLIAALIILGVEMVLGTIYLLAVFLGFIAGGLCALIGMSITSQMVVAGIVTLIGAVCTYVFRKKLRELIANKKKDSNNLDLGQMINVEHVDANGRSKVKYRGALWDAEAADGKLENGIWYIARRNGNLLILVKDKVSETNGE